jgi:hypothetical protein
MEWLGTRVERLGEQSGGAEETDQQIHGEKMKETSRQSHMGTGMTDYMPK